MITKIDDLSGRQFKRLLEQFKNKPNLKNFIEVWIEQLQELECRVFEVFDLDSINNAQGAILDLIGTIIGRPRQSGESDNNYRIGIKAQIGINVSEGELERIISVSLLLLSTPFIHVVDLGRGEIAVEIPAELNQAQIDEYLINAEKLAAGGVRIGHIECISEDCSFRFAGLDNDPPGKGFADPGGDGDQGLFATPHSRTKPLFAFSDTNGLPAPNQAGFADPTNEFHIGDPLAGGVFPG